MAHYQWLSWTFWRHLMWDNFQRFVTQMEFHWMSISFFFYLGVSCSSLIHVLVCFFLSFFVIDFMCVCVLMCVSVYVNAILFAFILSLFCSWALSNWVQYNFIAYVFSGVYTMTIFSCKISVSSIINHFSSQEEGERDTTAPLMWMLL